MGQNTREQYPNPVLQSMLTGVPLKSDAVAVELAALRFEIERLREALTPPKSAIITGPEVERVFATLKDQHHD